MCSPSHPRAPRSGPPSLPLNQRSCKVDLSGSSIAHIFFFHLKSALSNRWTGRTVERASMHAWVWCTCTYTSWPSGKGTAQKLQLQLQPSACTAHAACRPLAPPHTDGWKASRAGRGRACRFPPVSQVSVPLSVQDRPAQHWPLNLKRPDATGDHGRSYRETVEDLSNFPYNLILKFNR